MKPEETERFKNAAKLLRNLKENRSQLKQLLDSISALEEDGVYRFYHQSFKVYRLQDDTEKMVSAFRGLLPYRELNEWFLKLVKEGTGKQFVLKDNNRWLEATRPIVEAFFHAKYFLEIMARHSDLPESSLSGPLDSGLAALLYLYNLR